MKPVNTGVTIYDINMNEWTDWMDGYDQAAVDAAHERARQSEKPNDATG